MDLLGRKEQQAKLKHNLQASDSKLIAVFGRRRVGKTFLIRSFFEKKIRFEISGLYQGNMHDQLEHFHNTLIKHKISKKYETAPTSWMQAFDQLTFYIESFRDKRKKVIFIDELPWFDTPRSKFVQAFENFWNSYCSKRKDILLIICGSAASWMINKILHNKGGLHNRISEKINLQPFKLHEVEQYLKVKGIRWSRYDIIRLYMTIGGVPFYLDAIRKGESYSQFTNRICFEPSGLLYDEFQELYASLFNNNEVHEKIVEALSTAPQGMNRNTLIQKTKIPSGGTLSKILDELERSGFIEYLIPFNESKSKGKYRLIDPFSVFYFKFMISKGRRIRSDWTKKVHSPSWRSWTGFAFERICFYHRKQILQGLNLSAIECHISNLDIPPSGHMDGAQIDMIIDRADDILHICELKFSNASYSISKSYAKKIRHKLQMVAEEKEYKNKTLFFTMITPEGLTENEYSHELVQNDLTLADLFRE